MDGVRSQQLGVKMETCAICYHKTNQLYALPHHRFRFLLGVSLLAAQRFRSSGGENKTSSQLIPTSAGGKCLRTLP